MNSPYRREYDIFKMARRRCTVPSNPKWLDYGGRGIKFLFTSFEQFIKELGPRPSPTHTVDRRDNNGNYEPGNVRWATMREQIANRRPRKDALALRFDHCSDDLLIAEIQRRGLVDRVIREVQ